MSSQLLAAISHAVVPRDMKSVEDCVDEEILNPASPFVGTGVEGEQPTRKGIAGSFTDAGDP
jgi:hypothetical protein